MNRIEKSIRCGICGKHLLNVFTDEGILFLRCDRSDCQVNQVWVIRGDEAILVDTASIDELIEKYFEPKGVIQCDGIRHLELD